MDLEKNMSDCSSKPLAILESHSERNKVKESARKRGAGTEKEVQKTRQENDSDSNDSDRPLLSTTSRTKIKRKERDSSQTLEEKIKNKSKLPVTCGKKKGILYIEEFEKVEKCILSEEQWFTPSEFEMFGGKGKHKKWKTSIHYTGIPLQKLIQDGYLSSPKCNRSNVKKEQGISPESSPVAHHLRRRKHKREQLPSSSSNVDDEDDSCDNIDMSKFQGATLPVTCGSDCGILHKQRFVNGFRGKCIRTETGWFTPEEFVMQEPTLEGSGLWKIDILCHGKTLNFLLMKDILRIHLILCDCKQCSNEDEELLDQNNDDVCYVCHTGGKLVCCDECPLAFHSDCHLPAVDGDSPGDWVCTFCMLKMSQQWRYSSHMSEQEALNAAVPQYRLYCHCLLLCVYREDIQHVFVEDPRKTVARYSEFITQPMWLNRIKLKLEHDEYRTVGEFVSDFQLIFSNCSRFNKDSEFGRMGAKLKKLFESKFRNVFTIH